MAQSPPAAKRKLDPFAALLSYLIPGLGQIYQGRVGKGVLFLVCIYTLFFYGMRLGQWRNVYLPDTNTKGNMFVAWKPIGDIENRPHFGGQMFIGIAAWPAFIQYAGFDPKEEQHGFFKKWMRQPWDPKLPTQDPRFPNYNPHASAPFAETAELNSLQNQSDKRWDLGWVYTVIAGVLNILVIYDALAGPAHREKHETAAASKETVAK